MLSLNSLSKIRDIGWYICQYGVYRRVIYYVNKGTKGGKEREVIFSKKGS